MVDGAARHHELLGDVRVPLANGNATEDVELAGGELGRVGARCRPGTARCGETERTHSQAEALRLRHATEPLERGEGVQQMLLLVRLGEGARPLVRAAPVVPCLRGRLWAARELQPISDPDAIAG